MADVRQIDTYEELQAIIRESGKEFDREQIAEAFLLADRKHRGQKRSSGEPYIIHPLSVAAILVDLGMDTQSVVAGLLHDVVEDTDCTLEDITQEFGREVALLIDGVTKLDRIPFSSKEEEQAENLRKMLMAMAQDIRVIIIKFADRMHNLSTLEFMSPQKQRDKARECLEVYAPIAHRLGMRMVKETMEDVSLMYLDPAAYKEIDEHLEARSRTRTQFISGLRKEIRERVEPALGHEVYIEGRVKSKYSIYRKMFIGGKDFEEIYDVFAMRVIVDTIEDCYNVLGIVHDMFTPLPNRFKDYISTPKPNMYQSLHTTVITKAGVPFEVQIRTWEMHQTAEYGIAAHWKYKLGMSRKQSDNRSLDDRLAWIRQMLENQEDTEDVTDLVHSIKSDLIPEEVFVFTPKGDVINLPQGSSVIDFAYAIHSAVGNRMIGAKVDKHIVPLDYKVKTGEIIEILTSKETRGPNRDWLTMVRTSEARSKIRAWFKKERREENIVEGRAELERELRRSNISMSRELMNDMVESIGKRHNCSTADDLYAAIGYGGIQLWKVLPRIREEYQRMAKAGEPPEPLVSAPPKTRKVSGGVLVEGMDNCLTKLSRCCNPLPGDDIIGFITRGFGVSIHKRSCRNVPRDLTDCPEPERWVNAYWEGEVRDDFKSTLHIVALDRGGLLFDVTQQLSALNIFIHSLNCRQEKGGPNAVISATVSISGLQQLQSIIDRLSRVKGVISIDRT